MNRTSEAATSPSLLGRLGLLPTDQAAWNEFVSRYAPKMYAWCRQSGAQEADAQDVTQAVLTKLAEKMRSFRYDPGGSFRGWLKTLTRHAWDDLRQSQQRAGLGSGGSQVPDWLQTVEAREDLVKHLSEAFDQELLAEATARVRLRVASHTWEAFRLTALDGWSGAQTAEKLGMKVATVFVARNKVQNMLQQEIHKLEEADSSRQEDRP